MISLVLFTATGTILAEKPAELTYPPSLPTSKQFVRDQSDEFLEATPTLRDAVAIAKAPPTIG